MIKVEGLSLVESARVFAVLVHKDQKYGIHPYVYHLDKVHDILHEFLGEFKCGELCISAYLHDSIEDTPLTIELISHIFGKDVAYTVYCVTDESGRNRKERKEKTYKKITSVVPKLLKLADRLANVRQSKEFNQKLLDMYKKEQADFIKGLELKKEPTCSFDYVVIQMTDAINKVLNYREH